MFHDVEFPGHGLDIYRNLLNNNPRLSLYFSVLEIKALLSLRKHGADYKILLEKRGV